MGRGPSVVARPEERGKGGGGGGEDLACCPVSALPALLQPIEGTLPTEDSGLHWPWGCGGSVPGVHLPAVASGGSVPSPIGTTAFRNWNGRSPGSGDGEGGRWRWGKGEKRQ